MRRIDFVTLRLFVAIAETRSLTRAAEREHLALAAVSKRVSDLEGQLDVSLLYRQPKGVELTPAGHALLHHARNLLDNLQQLDADLSEFSQGVKGHVRIHANTSAVIEFLPEDLSAFARQHPEVKIDLEERVSSDTLRALREGLTDIGIFAGHMPAEDLQVFPYREDRLVLVTPREHPLAGRECIALREAAGFDFIGLQQDASLHALLQQSAQQMGTPLAPAHSGTQLRGDLPDDPHRHGHRRAARASGAQLPAGAGRGHGAADRCLGAARTQARRAQSGKPVGDCPADARAPHASRRPGLNEAVRRRHRVTAFAKREVALGQLAIQREGAAG